ncbi:MAG: hypothetical protein WAN65_07140 [Candidatus Sulfotelmatobacter sp.]
MNTDAPLTKVASRQATWLLQKVAVSLSFFNPHTSVLSMRVPFLELQPPLMAITPKETKMQKAHLFEALWMVNQGIDNAVQGLQRLKKKSELLQEPFAETVARLESDRAQVNVRFFAIIEARQQRETEQLIRS